MSVVAWTDTAAACSTPGRAWSPVPECFGYEEEDEEEAEADHDRRDPENPAPAQGLHDGSADEWDQVLAAEQQKRVDAQSVRALVQEEDFSNGGRGKTFDGRDGHALDDACNDEGSVIG